MTIKNDHFHLFDDRSFKISTEMKNYVKIIISNVNIIVNKLLYYLHLLNDKDDIKFLF